MFGVVHACRQTLDDELIEQWRAHLCGLCLSLRDSRGQLSRVATNTDAVMLSVLLEAQQTGTAERSTAGPCPLRGMRSAQVVPADAVAARLGATASLTLAAAKAGDVHAEQEFGLARTTVRDRAVGAMAGPLRRLALSDSPIADSVSAIEVLDDLAGQGELESAVRAGDSVLTVTRPSARAAGRIFAASAELSGHPENADSLREIGEAFGALAHLLDAVEDLAADRRSGSFNPIIATGATLPSVRRECWTLVRRIRHSFDDLVLSDGRLARALLVDGTHSAVHKAFGPRAKEPPNAPPAWIPPDTPPPPKEPPRPPFWPSVLPWIGVYCTGYACCASHQNPCTGKRHDPGCSNCNWCDGGDCGTAVAATATATATDEISFNSDCRWSGA